MAKSSVMLLSSEDRRALMEDRERGALIKDLAPKYQVSRTALSRFFNRKRSFLQINVQSNDPEFTRALAQLIEAARDSSKIKMGLE